MALYLFYRFNMSEKRNAQASRLTCITANRSRQKLSFTAIRTAARRTHSGSTIPSQHTDNARPEPWLQSKWVRQCAAASTRVISAGSSRSSCKRYHDPDCNRIRRRCGSTYPHFFGMVMRCSHSPTLPCRLLCNIPTSVLHVQAVKPFPALALSSTTDPSHLQAT